MLGDYAIAHSWQRLGSARLAVAPLPATPGESARTIIRTYPAAKRPSRPD